MPKITMTKGLPGSGKSTWAKAQCIASQGQTKRLNKDSLRDMLDGGEWSKAREKYVLATRDNLLLTMLADGYNVIIDDTNLAPFHEARLRELAKQAGATFAVQDFRDVPLETCIKRDLERPISVGESVIRKMWKQFLFTPGEQVAPPAHVPGAPRAIIVDIDGTVAKMVARGPHDYDKVGTDAPNLPVIRVVQEWVQAQYSRTPYSWHLIFVSGRPELCRADTEAWLRQHVLVGVLRNEWSLFMRPTYIEATRHSDKPQRDFRKDVIIKKEIYEREIAGKYNIDYCLDDRAQTVQGWRDLGLLCLAVAPGDF